MFFPSGGTGRQIFFPTAGRDGNYIFLRRGGTVDMFSSSSAERGGRYIFLLSCCKVGAVVREDLFPALLVALREPRPDADVFILDPRPTSKLREVLPLHGRRFFSDFFPPLPQNLNTYSSCCGAHGGCSDYYCACAVCC